MVAERVLLALGLGLAVAGAFGGWPAPDGLPLGFAGMALVALALLLQDRRFR